MVLELAYARMNPEVPNENQFPDIITSRATTPITRYFCGACDGFFEFNNPHTYTGACENCGEVWGTDHMYTEAEFAGWDDVEKPVCGGKLVFEG